MKGIIRKIKANTLLKLASFNSVSVIIRIITGFITSKIIAIYLGAEGLALVGNFRNFVASVQSVSVLGTNEGLVKYVAEYKKRPKKLLEAVTTTTILIFVATLIVGVSCFFLSDYISSKLFNSSKYNYIIKIFAVVLPFYSFNKIVLSLINGFLKFKVIITFNIIAQVLGAIVTMLLIITQQLRGALIAVVIAEALIIFATVFVVVKQRLFSILIQKKKFSKAFVKKIVSFSGMALFSAIVLPFLMVYIRTYIINTVGLKEAGFWEAMNRISSYYLMFMSSLIGIYILPRFSEITTNKAFKDELLSFFKTLMPVFGLGLVVIYFLRHFIIKLILTDAFLPVSELFFWQLLGDFVKIIAVVIAYQFLAKRLFWSYILAETISVVSLYVASRLLIDKYGVIGANMAHLVNYLVYLVVILIIFRKSLFSLGKYSESN